MTLWQETRRFARLAAQSARLMVGQQDYENYLQHFREHHPELEPLSEQAFFRACQAARYPGKGLSRCPC